MTRRVPLWVAYLLGGAVAVAAYAVIVGRLHPGSAAPKVAVYVGVSASAAVALVVGRRRFRPEHRGPWLLLAAAQVVYAAADTVFYVRHDLLGLADFPSVADLLYGARYPLVGAAVFLLIRRRSGRRDLEALLDVLIVVFGVALLLWVFVLESLIESAGDDPLIVVGVTYQPLLDLAVLALVVRLAFGGGAQPPAFRLLVGYLLVNLATDTLYGLLQATGTYLSSSLLEVGWLSSYVLLGVAALHPSMGRLSTPHAQEPRAAGPGRVALLGSASMTPPVAMVLYDRVHGHTQVLAAAGAAAFMFALVILRLAGLVASARRAAVIDALTGLCNRTLFLEHVHRAQERARRDGSTVGVLFIDVDRFKLVNDSLGHAAGDDLLLEVAARLRSCLRVGDVAGRHGGDEFTVLLPGLRTEREGREVAERIRGTLSAPVVVGGQHHDLTVSVGLVLDTHAEDGPHDLLRHADSALYRAKDGGRNRVEAFDPATRDAVRRRVSDEGELRLALADGQLVAWFQPVVDLGTGRIVGAEALARWLHPVDGLRMPGSFLPLATEAGLLGPLSDEIARQAVELRDRLTPWVPGDFRLSFNLGVRDLALPQVIEREVRRVADRPRLPSGLTLEITETAVVHDPPAARSALTAAREAGFAVALDDFGTGFSSLSLLRDLPLDVIKVDRSFVRGMGTSAVDAAVVEAVVALAERLGLAVVAEGVETVEDAARLTAAGVVQAQGFLYTPAVPPDQLVTWLRERAPWEAAAVPSLTAGG